MVIGSIVQDALRYFKSYFYLRIRNEKNNCEFTTQ